MVWGGPPVYQVLSRDRWDAKCKVLNSLSFEVVACTAVACIAVFFCISDFSNRVLDFFDFPGNGLGLFVRLWCEKRSQRRRKGTI